MAVAYFSWAGIENNKIYFMIRPISEIKGESDRVGYTEVDTEDALYTNALKPVRGGAKSVEVWSENIFYTIEEAMQNIFKDIFREA